ncbi:vegetative cell wall protein gp1-like [Stylophora pistillata]|uniref:Uncharacterized protein n=1 Tax=Stylophora pistillata TaxID=50429 RepID=A0A2B4T0L3_STYPI|nr:vegetative cell wall protein gp1-like [Stylophora pistillata]PFX34328.1 hypothetical protein AWC38_SpisGene741 [Stylophora pistillata]
MQERLVVRLVVGQWLLVVISSAAPQAQYQLRRPVQTNAQTRTFPQNLLSGRKGPQTQFQFRRPIQMGAQVRNFLPNRLITKKAGRYPPLPPSKGAQLPADNRNFIPNRFDIPASVIHKKPGSSVGCVGADPCGLLPPYSSPALPLAPPPVPYAGFPPPPVPYGPQRYAQPAPMAPNGYGMHSINAMAQDAAAAMASKLKILGGTHPEKKFVPHLPPMGRQQPGKPPYDPPPPPPAPQATAGFAPGLPGQLPYQQPFGYNQQGMPPQTAAFDSQPAPGFPQPVAPPMQGSFADQQTLPAPLPFPQNQAPAFLPQQQSPTGPQTPQLVNNDVPQVPFPAEMNQAPAFNDPGQQMAPNGSFDLAKKRMMALKLKGQMKRFGVPRPVQKSRLTPKPLFKRHL